jgi:hypothetical protein
VKSLFLSHRLAFETHLHPRSTKITEEPRASLQKHTVQQELIEIVWLDLTPIAKNLIMGSRDAQDIIQ